MDPSRPPERDARLDQARHITSSETRRWCRAREREEPLARLLVSASLAAPVAAGPNVAGRWHLDALLGWALCDLLGRRISRDGDPAPITLPLARLGGVWSASCLAPAGDAAWGYTRWRRRPDADAAERWLAGGRLPRSVGPRRAHDAPLEVCTTTELVAACVGRPEAVRTLLGRVGHVGKKGSQGYGSLQCWRVERVDGDPDPAWPLVDGEGLATRPLPVELAVSLGATGRRSYGRVTPPYWWAGGTEEVVCP